MKVFKKITNCDFIFLTADEKGFLITKSRIDHLNCKLLYKAAGLERKQYIENLKNEGYFVIYVGDSLSDIPAICSANLSACPLNAYKIVKCYVDFVSEYNGSEGAFGDILLNILLKNSKTNK